MILFIAVTLVLYLYYRYGLKVQQKAFLTSGIFFPHLYVANRYLFIFFLPFLMAIVMKESAVITVACISGFIWMEFERRIGSDLPRRVIFPLNCIHKK